MLPILFLILSIAFAFVCLVVFYNNGKSKKWVLQKLKIGGLLFPLMATAAASAQDVKVASYETAAIEIDVITLKEIGGNKNDFDRLSKIEGTVSHRQSDHFSFCLINVYGKKVYADNILPADNKFDSENENFIIHMPDKLPEGQYHMVIYNDSKNNQRTETEKQKFVISL